MSEQQNRKGFLKEWLEKLQQESWQLELLISGFALFGIFESRPAIVSFQEYLSLNSVEGSLGLMVLRFFGFFLEFAWIIFSLNLLIHVILRGFWIGAIGLRYVSGEIDYKSLGYSEIFHEYFIRNVGDFDDFIEKLEKICSVIFAYTFLLFFFFLSLILFFIEASLLARATDWLKDAGWENLATFIMAVFIIGGIVVLIDFLSSGSIKTIKNKRIAKLYLAVFRFYATITLSFLYRPLLFNFIDYKYTRRLFKFSVPYFLAILFLPGFFLSSHPFFPTPSERNDYYDQYSSDAIPWRFYDDLRQQQNEERSGFDKRTSISYITIPSRDIKENYLQIFLRYLTSDDKIIKSKYPEIPPFREIGMRHHAQNPFYKDTITENLDKERGRALLKIMRERREATKNEPKKEFKDYGLLGNQEENTKAQTYGPKDADTTNIWGWRTDSIRRHYDFLKDSLYKDKILKIKKIYQNLNQLSIDGTNINNNLSCKFYTHPNMGEPGLLCYYALDSLSKGEHLLTLNRSVFNPQKLDSLQVRTLHVPFWVFR